MSQEVVIAGACRTAIGRHGGSLQSMSALDISIPVMQEVLRRAGVAPALIEDVIWGCNYQKTFRENNLARVAAVKAGMPVSVPGITVHRNCTSAMSAIQLGYYQIKAGEAEVIMAGGADSMSNASYTIDKLRWGSRLGHAEVRDSMWDSLTELGVGPAMGITAENLAERYGISRQEQDQLALLSQQRAARAQQEGRFAGEILPLEVKQRKKTVVFDIDEHPRADTTLESLAGLKPAFKKDGTVTAGNASGINDGGAGLLLMSRAKAEELGAPVMARILGTATCGVEPEVMGIGPVEATRRALAKAGLTLGDMELVELNEAFAAQYLACEKEMGLNREITNVNGSGISLGHPVGCTGARITTTLLYEMAKRGLKLGLAALCAGGGMGTALVLERETA
ncbi:MAG: thiolase family protein [Desulfarculaceae bacterium]|nr:thiolase family protein [Desulfarculaceae bacterium]MCF8071169.1 thiolase family protein [Desulfarculaceae bacterium]MCF8101228.1 thiolase family protein [Desulfarculaceae bacterium]MCF8115223.1 thiolase family protein [Desulfarculaceae bacterium]